MKFRRGWDGGWLTAGGGREALDPLIWFESRKEKCLGLNYAAFLTRTGDWCPIHLMPGHHICRYVWFVSCFSLPACLAASSLNFFSLDYQQCNWVRELCGPVSTAQACFCRNPSKLTAELWKVNKTTHEKLVWHKSRVPAYPGVYFKA